MRAFLLAGLAWAQAIWPGRILFELTEGYSTATLPEELVELQAQLRGSIRPRFPTLKAESPIYVLEYQADLPPTYVVKLWGRSPAVRYAEPEYIPQLLGQPDPQEVIPNRVIYTPNDVHSNNFCLSHLHVFAAWDSTKGDTTVWIGVVDTDVRFDHPDLVENIAYNWNDPIDGVDNDGDGHVDNFHGWDIVGSTYSGSGPFSPDNDPRTASPGHGTWVAGYAGATTDNGIGIASPGFMCRILPVKAAPDNNWALYGAYDGVIYAAQRGAKVINCSWGSTFRSQAAQNLITQLITQYDPLIVAAAGNIPPDTPATFYPAQYDGVTSVTGVNTSDVWYGTIQIGYGMDLATTGNGITTAGLSTYTNFGAMTSFAAPQASGCAAILRSWRPDLNALQIAELLRITADSVDHLNLPHLRYRLGRRINLYRAILTQDTPACRVTAWQAYDTNDSLLFAGETFFLTASYRNYLSPATNLTVSIEPLTPHLQVVSGSYTIGSLGTLQSHAQVTGSPFVLQVLPTCPLNATLPVLFRFQADGGYQDYQVIELRGVNPAFVHVDSALLRTTLCGNGRIGYYDTPANTQGRGARWNTATSSWLFEGGLMITDDTSAHLCTRAPLGGMYPHFAPTQAATHSVQGLYEIGEVAFMDTAGSHGPKGFSVRSRVYAARRDPLRGFVAFLYELENTSPTDYADLSVGWWLDFDVGNNPTTDVAVIHNTLPLVYARSGTSRYIGAVLLSGQTAVTHIGMVDTFSATYPSYIGLTRSSSSISSASGDIFVALSARGVNLFAGAKDTVAFAFVGGSTLSELLDNAQEALTWYQCFILGMGPVVDLGLDRAICLGDSLEGPSAAAYEWSVGSVAPVIYPTQSGLYWLLAQDAQGCWGYDEVQLTVNALLPAQVQFSPGLTLPVGESLQGQETSGHPYTYTWRVQTSNDWQIYSGPSFIHTYPTAGTYTIWLLREDPNTSCADSLSWEVIVSTSSTLGSTAAAAPQLLPNPTAGRFTLHYTGAMEGNIALYDLSGRLVWEVPLQPSGAEYRLPSWLHAGAYLWRVGAYRGFLLYLP